MSPEIVLFSLTVAALACYAVLGGADFGAGVWQFNTTLRSSKSDRQLLHRVFGSVWKANQVWLVFVLIGLWFGFPTAFAAICRIAWLPLSLGLLGIVVRGAAYALRANSEDEAGNNPNRDAIFALASSAAPFFFGCTVGVLATEQTSIDSAGQFSGNWLTEWISVESLFFGFFAVSICAYLASVFLVREAHVSANHQLEDLWRNRAFVTGMMVGFFAIAGWVVAATGMPIVWDGIFARGWPVITVSMIAGCSTIALIDRRRYALAILSASLTVAGVLAGWAISQYPYLVIPGITLYTAETSSDVLWLTVWCIAGGMLVVTATLIWLFYKFQRAERP